MTMTKIKRRAPALLGALAGIGLTAGVAAAQDGYTSTFVDDDADIYGYYDAGFDDVNADDDWFYDYYGLEPDLGDAYWSAADDWDEDRTPDRDDDAGDEGILDF